MYCKYCGKEIEDNSQYCRHCGRSLDNNNEDNSVIKDFIRSNKNFVWIYTIWVVLHIILFCFGENDLVDISPKDLFYPFTENEDYNIKDFNVWFYDITEFLCYCVLIPFISGLIIWKWKSFIKPIKIFVISYIVWLILNSILWARGESSYSKFWSYGEYLYSTDCFFPFTYKQFNNGKCRPMFDASFYDSVEFMIYCIILPLIIFWGIWYFKIRKK